MANKQMNSLDMEGSVDWKSLRSKVVIVYHEFKVFFFFFNLEGQKVYLELDVCINYMSLGPSLPCCVSGNKSLQNTSKAIFSFGFNLGLASR